MLAVVVAAALSGCGGAVATRASSPASAPAGTTPVATSAAASAAVAAAAGGNTTMEIVNYKFATPELTVAAGSTVTWINKDDFEHTATATDKTFDTSKLGKGASGKVTFDTAGTFNYICDIHQYMTGKVVVT